MSVVNANGYNVNANGYNVVVAWPQCCSCAEFGRFNRFFMGIALHHFINYHHPRNQPSY
jgi:hypothetical protein